MALSALLDRPQTFRLGAIQRIHQIGPYSIVEFKSKKDDVVGFVAYCGVACAYVVDPTLDRALIRAVVLNHSTADDVEPVVKVMSRLLHL